MGTWGPKLYQDDISEDVRSFYKDQLKHGKSNDEVLNELIEQNAEIIADSDDASIFWFALADTQWDLGRLLPIVKEKALHHLHNGSNLERWRIENPRQYAIRKKILEELEVKLNQPVPLEKKIPRYRLYKCEWKIGDIYACKFESEYARAKGYYDRYIIICKIDESTWWPGHIIPIVYTKISVNKEIPKSTADINRCEFIKTTCARRKPEYRMQLLSTSKKVIPHNKLVFIGNYPNIFTPTDEFIIHDKVSTVSCGWPEFEETIINNHLTLKCH